MSLTFGTLLILFFLIPGLVFRKSFFILPFDKRYAEGNTISEIALILITSVLVQWLGLFLVEHTSDCWYTECGDVYAFFREYIFSDPKNANCRMVYDNIDLEQFVLYQLSLWGLAVMLGFFFNSVVRYFRLDRKYRILRFGNSWYYYFSGEAIEFPDIGGDSRDIDYIFVDVLVRAEGKELIYIGILSEYELSPNGGLKSIALKGAKRRELGTDSETLPQERKANRTEEEILKEYYTIPSNLLVIPYNDNIVNINFRYYADDESDKGRSDNMNALERIVQLLSLAFLLIYLILAILWLKRQFSSEKQQPADDPANKPSDPSEPSPEP